MPGDRDPAQARRMTRAVVLARGLGTRKREPDDRVHLSPEQARAADAGLKAMLPIHGRPFLDYVLSATADAGVRDVALIVAPDHDRLREHFAAAHPERLRVSFVVQPEPRGTADAVLAARAWTAGAPFLVMNADNLYPVDALRALVAANEPSFPAFDSGDLIASSNIPPDRVRAFALVELDADGYMTSIVEKPADADGARAGERRVVSMNCWRFDARIFDACRDVPASARGELELPEAVGLAVARGMRIRALPARGPVLDLSRRADAADVERRLAGVVPWL
jgi:glucose-1-phosphate thymidylyltransferase